MSSTDFGLFFVGVAIALLGVGLHTHHRKQLDADSAQREAVAKQGQSYPPGQASTGAPTPTTPALGETAKLLQP